MVWSSTRFVFPAFILLRILPPIPLTFNWPLLISLSLIVSILGLLSRPSPIKQYAFFCLFLLVLLGVHNHRLQLLQQAQNLPIPDKEYLDLEGTVCTQIQPWQESGYAFTLKLKTLRYRRKGYTLPLRIRIHLVRGPLPEGLARSARIKLAAEFSPMNGQNNFNLPDRQLSLLSRAIDCMAVCKSPLLIQVDRPAPLPWRWLHRWREKLNRSIDSLPLPDDIRPLSVPLFKAVFLGHAFQGDSTVHRQFMISGSLHLLAISGTHIALIATFSAFLFFWAPSGLRRFLVAAIILLYLLTAAAPISAQRAAIAAWAWLWASHRKRQLHLDHVLGLWAGIELLINPFIVYSAAFILTYSICFALIYHARQLKIPGPKKDGRYVMKWGLTLMKTQGLALLASAPLTLHLFNQCSINTLPAGMILIPLFTLLMPLSGIFLLLYTFVPATFSIGATVLVPLLTLLQKLLQFFMNGEFLLIYRQSPPFWMLTIYLGLLFLSARKTLSNRIRKAFMAGVFGIFIFQLLPDSPRRPPSTEIHIPDIGQGEINIIVFPSGKSLLIDCGGAPFSDQRAPTRTVAAYLLNNHIHPEWIAVSHFHSDHCGTLPDLLRIFNPKAVFYSEQPAENPLFIRTRGAGRHGLQWVLVRKGFRLHLDDTRFTWLYPDQTGDPRAKTRNGHSQVIRMESHHLSMLFCGDIGAPEELQLMSDGNPTLGSLFLKVPHHGSQSSTSHPFLKAVSPRLGIVHCSRNNPFHFPHPAVTNRFEELDIPIWHSWQGGLVISQLHGTPSLKTATGQLISGMLMTE